MSKGGVRCMEISPDNTKLVVAGDDENGLVLNYSQWNIYKFLLNFRLLQRQYAIIYK